MKKFTWKCLLPLMLIVLVSSCGGDGSDGVGAALLAERDSLKVLADENQRELERMTDFFDSVAACIDSISEQESLLTVTVDPETNRRYSSREMTSRLNQLSEIINNQRSRIASLVDSLNNSMDTTRINGLSNTIAFLTEQLNQKEAVIAQMRAELQGERRNVRRLTSQVESLTETVEDLSTQNTALTEAVQVQTEIINEGLVLIASERTLKDMGVIQGGGFLRKSKVVLANVNPNSCTRVDISQFTDIPINYNKVKILSPAPEGSYTLTRTPDGYQLRILNSTQFWSLSNVLVIQIK